MNTTQEPLIRVMALHAIVYCPRLFYLEEVEELRVADASVWAGRRLHHERVDDGELEKLVLESERIGIRGKIDAIRRRNGRYHIVEHKRGRSKSSEDGSKEAWPSDRVQACAYAMLLEEHIQEPVEEVRVRYHRDNTTVRISLTEEHRQEVIEAIALARQLSKSPYRPPIHQNSFQCTRCSLAPVCLPEETRYEEQEDAPKPRRLFPPDPETRSLYLQDHNMKIGRSGEALVVKEGRKTLETIGAREVSDVVIQGNGQMTTQALRLCAYQGIPVHYMTTSGIHLGFFCSSSSGVQRRIRQFQSLTHTETKQKLTQKLVQGKIEMQLKALLRLSRGNPSLRQLVEADIEVIRKVLKSSANTYEANSLLGYEGLAGRAYFSALPHLVKESQSEFFQPKGRTRRPPKDRFNALLSYGYSLLYRDVLSAILQVGLEPSFGFYHKPRSSSFPLALDLMELFRVPMVDLTVLAAVNRATFDPHHDFAIAGEQVWLSKEGRKKFIMLYERRKRESYKHPVLNYSLSYRRLIELETRLLEKEWSGESGLFAQFRIR